MGTKGESQTQRISSLSAPPPPDYRMHASVASFHSVLGLEVPTSHNFRVGQALSAHPLTLWRRKQSLWELDRLVLGPTRVLSSSRRW